MEERHERLAVALEDCRLRLARGETPAQCLAAHPTQAEELGQLLPLVAQVAQLAQEPDAAYTHAARQRFHARLATEQRRQAARPRWIAAPLRRLAIPLAAVAVLSASGVGLVTASAAALPGSPLYPIQRAQEQVALRLARTPQQQVAFQLRLVDRRIQQVQIAERRQASPAVIEALTAGMVNASTRAAAELGAVPPMARQNLRRRLEPLLTQEERLLSQGHVPATTASRVGDQQRLRQVLSIRRRLQAAQVPTAVSELPSPVSSRHATARPSMPTTATGSSAERSAPARTAGATRTPFSRPPEPTPHPGRANHTPSPPRSSATAARLRRLVSRFGKQRRPPVHAPAP